ncbi:growth-regulating factor 1-like [Chenopodium quinoa]|uniref:growth-regulating factor 1-like n=1 Tax=Chenopodium quinoa TaxID=63459 RepID=UPI000B7785DA|nr:growth-regulating factor 1-like [Chenopodium quinoa]
MDFDGLVVGQTAVSSSCSDHQNQILEGKPKCSINGSGLIKQERSDPFVDEDNRVAKIVKRADDLGLRSDNAVPKQQMLSFSSSTKPQQLSFLSAKDVNFISDNKNAQNLLLSYFQQQQQQQLPSYSRTPAGFNHGNLNGSMHGSFSGIRGPFTPAQWIELEHQAMIYKYITANVPVPANLLIPIRKALCSSGFPGFSFGSYPPHSYGWGTFHLGFSGSTDPEPGRCRRTDGKKWRCSKDAVPDQKYCERHINRGRHRSRKPVEGHTGQAASGPTNTKVIPAMSSSMSSLVTSTGGASNSTVTIAHQHHIKGLQPPGANNAAADSIVNRFHDEQGLSTMPPTMNLKTNDSPFSIAKQHIQLDDSSQSEFGLVSTDSLLNPTQKSAYLGCKSYNSSILEFNAQQTQDQYPLRHFMDVWPKDNSNRSSIPWPEDSLKSDWTQLSMSIPMSTTDFSSSSSPNQEKATVSPLRLSREFDPSQMGVGVGTIVGETGMKQNAWIPISWGNNSMGGPLGEVLNNTSNITSALNLKGDQRCDGSPQLGSSPTGVLQKSTFVSLSNSSSAGSPRAENKKTLEGANLCDDILGSAVHASSTFVPSM